jgi:hypothetical protein
LVKSSARARPAARDANVLCAILAGRAALVGLAASALFALWWLDPAVALVIAAAVKVRRRGAGKSAGASHARKTARAGFYILCFLRGRRLRQKSRNGPLWKLHLSIL